MDTDNIVKVKMASVLPDSNAEGALKATYTLMLLNEDNISVSFQLDVVGATLLAVGLQSALRGTLNQARAEGLIPDRSKSPEFGVADIAATASSPASAGGYKVGDRARINSAYPNAMLHGVEGTVIETVDSTGRLFFVELDEGTAEPRRGATGYGWALTASEVDRIEGDS